LYYKTNTKEQIIFFTNAKKYISKWQRGFILLLLPALARTAGAV